MFTIMKITFICFMNDNKKIISYMKEQHKSESEKIRNEETETKNKKLNKNHFSNKD